MSERVHEIGRRGLAVEWKKWKVPSFVNGHVAPEGEWKSTKGVEHIVVHVVYG
jgi:hypothetical protein